MLADENGHVGGLNLLAAGAIAGIFAEFFPEEIFFLLVIFNIHSVAPYKGRVLYHCI